MPERVIRQKESAKMNDIDLMSVLLGYESSKDVVIKGGQLGKPGAQVTMIKDGAMLSPRETRKWVIAAYEDRLGRKLSKKEANLAMATIRRYLTVHTGEDCKVFSQIHNREVIVSGITTWDKDTPFDASASFR